MICNQEKRLHLISFLLNVINNPVSSPDSGNPIPVPASKGSPQKGSNQPSGSGGGSLPDGKPSDNSID
jgi:hypothetical protein